MPRSSGGSSAPKRVSLAPTNPDPVASMRRWPIDVDLGDRVFRIPALDAAGWLEVLLAPELDTEALFPGLCGPEAVIEVNQMILSGQVGASDLEQAIMDVIEAASGRRWWITVRLAAALRANWEMTGARLAAAGVQPWGVPLSFWLDAAYVVFIETLVKANPEKIQVVADFAHQLTTPPASQVRGSFDEAANASAFLAAMRAAR